MTTEHSTPNGQVGGQNMPEPGELVWYRMAENDWVPAIWITPPGTPHWRYATVMMRGETVSGCHYTRFRRGERPTDEPR